MCWKKSLREGNEVQADGSCLSFLPVRVRMPRVTQGSDPALSWGAAPFPQDPNIPQGAKTGKKKSLMAGCACQTQLRPFLGCWERLSSASRVDPQEFTPPNPLWTPNGPAPPALAGLGCLPGQLWPHRLPAHLDFSVPAAGFTALDAGAAPGWGSERRRGDSGHQEGPGQQQNPRAQRDSGSRRCWDPVEIQAEGSSASVVPVFRNPVGNSLLSRPEKVVTGT